MKPTLHAIARRLSRSLPQCQLTHVPRSTFDLAVAERQHAAYLQALANAGVALQILPEEPALPDAAFVEDTAIILDELAILCRTANETRQPESSKISSHLEFIRPTHRITSPATLEGGDVLRLGKILYVGQSTRTNAEGIRQLARIVAPHGYSVIPVQIKNCLHLKTAITAPTQSLLIANPDWLDLTPFRNVEILKVPPTEPWAANTLPVHDTLFVAASSPETADLLSRCGLHIQPLDISELQKAEAGLTCLTLLFK